MTSTLVRGVCLVNGRHTPGSDWERECPHRNAAKRSERSRKAAATRLARAEAAPRRDAVDTVPTSVRGVLTLPPRSAKRARFPGDAGGPLTCRLRSCRRPFERPVRQRGSPRAFCSDACRTKFHSDACRIGSRALGPRPKPAARPKPVAWPATIWRSAIDAATGKRVRITIKVPTELLVGRRSR